MTASLGRRKKLSDDPHSRHGSIIADRYQAGRWKPKEGLDVAATHFLSNEEVAKELQKAVGELAGTTKKYGHVTWFTLFVAAYMVVLYFQASTYKSAAVVATLKAALLPDSGSTSMSFTSGDQVLAYLGEKVVRPVWRDPVCGDGKCEYPWEFPAWGRFGCRADCGLHPNTSTTILAINADFTGHPTLAARMLADNAAWNLCLDDPQRRGRGEQDLCWFSEDQRFREVQSGSVQRLELPDGRWYISVNGDLAGRVAGAAYHLGPGDEPLKMLMEPELDTCVITRRRGATAAANQGLRRLLEEYVVAARLPEAQGRALLEAAAGDVSQQLQEAQAAEQARLAGLKEHVERKLAVLEGRRQSAAIVQGMNQQRGAKRSAQ